MLEKKEFEYVKKLEEEEEERAKMPVRLFIHEIPIFAIFIQISVTELNQ